MVAPLTYSKAPWVNFNYQSFSIQVAIAWPTRSDEVCFPMTKLRYVSDE